MKNILHNRAIQIISTIYSYICGLLGQQYPACWTAKQWADFSKDFCWLGASGGALGCTVCHDVGSIGPNRTATGMRTKLSPEWVNFKIQPYGTTRNQQLAAIRKKIYEHRDSASHKQAIVVHQSASLDTLKTVVVENQREHVDVTCKVFRTVYYVAANNRPYVDHPGLIDLQLLNGLKLGRMLHSNNAATDISDHIADEMRRKLMKSVVDAKMPFSVLIDESTSLSQKSCLIVYLRCTVEASCEPVTCFLDLMELSSLTADAVIESLMTCLHKNGLNDECLREYWLGLGTDGASVMLGKKAGVYVKLKEKFPNLIGWHCFNHRLELSVNDCVKACTQLNHFKIFMQKLYTLYSASPKNRRALEQCAADVGAELLKIGRVLDVRWVASSFRAVKAVWNNYAALFAHFSSASTDNTLDSKERAQFKGLATKISSSTFLSNLGLMYDALQELSDLSESLQAESINLPKAH